MKQIESKDYCIGIIGLGYVGLPLFCSFANAGYKVIGFDKDQQKIMMLKKGQSYINYIPTQDLTNKIKSGEILVTSAFTKLRNCNAIIIVVPTPLTIHKEPDLSCIKDTCHTIYYHLHPNQIIILESTTYPGTTEEIVIPILEKSGLFVDKDFLIAYSPEREDPNNSKYSLANTPKIIGSTSQKGLLVASKLYEPIVGSIVPVSSLKIAETTKLLENIFRTVNIALVNELKIVLDKMGIDINETIEAASTKPFGFMPFYPGPGLGGHCIPIDPFYLAWKAKEYGVSTRFIELAGEINSSMPTYVTMKVIEVLNKYEKSLSKSKILLLGLAYKPDIDDDRESPTYYIMDKLEKLGATIEYNDPYIPQIKPTRRWTQFKGKKSSPINDSYDLMIILTAHEIYKTITFSQFTVPIIDTRSVLNTNESHLYYEA